MTVQDEIIKSVLIGKCASGCWAYSLIQQEKAGDNIDCCVAKLSLLNNWIQILEQYYCDVYTLDVDPCFEESVALELSGKLLQLIG